MSEEVGTVRRMADQHSFRSKLYTKLEEAIDKVEGANLNMVDKSRAYANIALAFRYAYGGQQPGGHADN